MNITSDGLSKYTEWQPFLFMCIWITNLTMHVIRLTANTLKYLRLKSRLWSIQFLKLFLAWMNVMPNGLSNYTEWQILSFHVYMNSMHVIRLTANTFEIFEVKISGFDPYTCLFSKLFLAWWTWEDQFKDVNITKGNATCSQDKLNFLLKTCYSGGSTPRFRLLAPILSANLKCRWEILSYPDCRTRSTRCCDLWRWRGSGTPKTVTVFQID